MPITTKLYNVTVYANRGRTVVLDQDFYKLGRAVDAFHIHAETCIRQPETAVLLSRTNSVTATGRFGTTLVHKSTDSDCVVFERAYYDELQAIRQRMQQNLELALDHTKGPSHG